MKRSVEKVNHPKHYNSCPAACLGCGRPIECIDVIEHFPLSEGNAMKYIWRAAFKGTEVEDLKKAIWYLQRAITKKGRKSRLKKGGAS